MDYRQLSSFPTRRSSDLAFAAGEDEHDAPAVDHLICGTGRVTGETHIGAANTKRCPVRDGLFVRDPVRGAGALVAGRPPLSVHGFARVGHILGLRFYCGVAGANHFGTRDTRSPPRPPVLITLRRIQQFPATGGQFGTFGACEPAGVEALLDVSSFVT